MWQYYAIDADGDGIKSVYDPADAIYAAAAMVRDLEALVGVDPEAAAGRVQRRTGERQEIQRRATVP